MSKIEELDDRLRELALLRQMFSEHLESTSRLREGWSESPEYKAWQASAIEDDVISRKVGEAEAEVRRLAVLSYEQSGEKKYPGVTVKIYNEMYYDMELAKMYCVERFPEALSVVKKTFERLAEAARPKFVTFKDVPRAAIDSDLSKFLEGE